MEGVAENGQPRQSGTDSKALRITATVLSYVLHPIFMPLVMMMVLYYISPVSFVDYDVKEVPFLFIRIGVTTIFFPLLVVVLLKALGFADSIQLRTRKERFVPLLATMIFYWWISHVFKNQNAPVMIQVLLRGAYWGIILLFLCSIFFKISMHTVAAGGMLGFMAVLIMTSPVNMTMPLMIALAIAGLIGTARLLLGAHTTFEIWMGYVVGIVAQLAAYWWVM